LKLKIFVVQQLHDVSFVSERHGRVQFFKIGHFGVEIAGHGDLVSIDRVNELAVSDVYGCSNNVALVDLTGRVKLACVLMIYFSMGKIEAPAFVWVGEVREQLIVHCWDADHDFHSLGFDDEEVELEYPVCLVSKKGCSPSNVFKSFEGSLGFWNFEVCATLEFAKWKRLWVRN